MLAIYTPKSESEAAVIASLLRAYDIDFVFRGGAFSTMYPGPVVNSLNEQALMVRADQAELARQLLREFIDE
ncbi:MAG: DUF2007 domain-containing protein [Candidimonas sp.]